MNNVAKLEIDLLDIDLRDIYSDYGTDNLYLMKRNATEQDDLYIDYAVPPTYTKYLVIGMITSKALLENTGDLGGTPYPHQYTVKILKSSLDEQGVTEINISDKLYYNGVELDIQSVNPHPLLGDYFVQYDIQAIGLPLVFNNNHEQ